jgi:hypothetical protein
LQRKMGKHVKLSLRSGKISFERKYLVELLILLDIHFPVIILTPLTLGSDLRLLFGQPWRERPTVHAILDDAHGRNLFSSFRKLRKQFTSDLCIAASSGIANSSSSVVLRDIPA